LIRVSRTATMSIASIIVVSGVNSGVEYVDEVMADAVAKVVAVIAIDVVELDEVEVVNVVESDVDAVMVVGVFELVDNVPVGVVEVEFVSVTVFRFSVIVPGPLNVISVGLLEPEHVNPPEQFQLENA